ncbi:MAG: hypothetical protein H6710_00585 [Myxococcales bacterium]|nr:hypothetical protein [Myxococcales bacterium]
MPALGEIEVALPRTYFGLVELDGEGRARLTIDGGLRLRLRELALRVALEEIEARADPFDLEITCEPAIGGLERGLLVRFLEARLGPLRAHLWPAEGVAPEGHRPLATLPLSPTIGPLRLSLPEGAVLRLALDRQMLELECEAGIHVRLDGAPWLPEVHLHKLTYTLADGAIDLRFSGVVERYYHEEESVSLITEAILAHVLRVLLSPKIPAWLLPLGFQRFELPPPPAPRPDRIVLFRLPLAADMGEATVAMEPDETILVTASADEIQITCDRGLWIALPALRFGLHARSARYHPRSGEVQVGGLGQLENAVIEAIIRQHLGRGRGGAPIGALIDELPIDAKGRRTLFTRGPIHVAMRTGTRFTLAFAASGIDFTADPPLIVDGPGVLDYQLRGLHYAFARAAFSLVLADDGVVASLFTGVVAETAESQLGELLRPLLPPAMREPGYSLARDPSSAESLAAVVAAFTGRGRAPRGSGSLRAFGCAGASTRRAPIDSMRAHRRRVARGARGRAAHRPGPVITRLFRPRAGRHRGCFGGRA